MSTSTTQGTFSSVCWVREGKITPEDLDMINPKKEVLVTTITRGGRQSSAAGQDCRKWGVG